MTEKTPEARMRFGDALVVGEFRAIFAAYSISMLGSVISAVALMVLVYQRTSSPLLSALTYAIVFLPFLVSGTVLSALVDRVPLRRLLVGCDLFSAAIVATMALPGTPVAALLPLLFVVGILIGVSSGARSAVIPSVVPAEAYVPASALMRITSQVTQIAGNGVAGVLLVVMTPRGALLVDASSFVLSAALVLWGMHARPTAAAPDDQLKLIGDSLRGLRAVLGHVPLRRLLLLAWLAPTFAVAPEALAAPYISGVGGDSSLVGWYLVALPLGVVIGDLLGVSLCSQATLERLVTPLAMAGFVPLIVFAFHPRFAIAFPLLVVAGMTSVYGLGLVALTRAAAPPALFSRSLAINSAGLMVMQGLGFACAGAVAEFLPAYATIALAGCAGLAVTAWLGPRRQGSMTNGAERAIV
jgi:MFS family permease